MPYPVKTSTKAAAPKIATMDAADMVNPYDSDLRQWVCTQLANLLPDVTREIRSDRKDTNVLFTEWTGYTQSGLETAWLGNGFIKSVTDIDKKVGVWVRISGVATTTCCEAVIGKLVQKIKRAGFPGGKPLKDRGVLGTFNLPGCKSNGMEPATTVGWHWYREKTKDLKPQAGDFFQIGTEVKPGQWRFAHVGVITDFWDFDDGNPPQWITVEGGQGGPGAGYDAIKRKGPRPVDPVDKRSPHKVLMGWLNIEEYFEGWDRSAGS
jgi:hypothetical protein